MRISQGLAIGGGIIAVVSMFLPWLRATESVAGEPIQGEEITLLQFILEGELWTLALVLFIIIPVVVSLMHLDRKDYYVGAFSTLIPVFLMGFIGSTFPQEDLSFGIGFYTCIVASLLYVAGGALVEDEKSNTTFEN